MSCYKCPVCSGYNIFSCDGLDWLWIKEEIASNQLQCKACTCNKEVAVEKDPLSWCSIHQCATNESCCCSICEP